MANNTISKESIKFLANLKKNNNRDWFTKNKPEYVKRHQNMIEFADGLLGLMNKHDKIETESGKKSMMRIYRDVRFSKDKSPYKVNWGMGFKRATKSLRGSYYFHVEPGSSFIGGGFWGPEPSDLKRIREDIANNDKPLRKILASKSFLDTFGILEGEQVKTAPKGFAKDHPAIDLLKYKQFLIGRKFTDKEILAPDFHKKANDTFKAMRPFFDYMSQVLTTNANGEDV